MTKHILLNKFYRSNWISNSKLHAVALAFEDYLRKRNYAERTIRSYLKALAHFAYWFRSRRLQLSDIDEHLCKRFTETHLLRCSCPKPCLGEVLEARPALMHLRAVLLEQGYSPKKADPFPFLCYELCQFQKFLLQTCGLAPATCKERLKVIRPFLQKYFGEDPINLSKLTAGDMDDFVLGFADRRKPSSLGVVRTSLRSYLRYRVLLGDQTESLSISLPVISNWKATSLPKFLTEAQIDIFLAAFNLSEQVGIRNYAIARVLVDLGLRGHELVELTLDSINWREGTVCISTNKGRQFKQLPLPAHTGAAIVNYLKKARPKTNSRTLFVRKKGNVQKPFNVIGIYNIVKRAFDRCGLGDQFVGIHVFRHTLAERLQRSGSSIKEIADVLRHKSLESTTFYAKVDLKSLRVVALPWPGRQT